ncbi:hypothetical protein [Acidiluteibacter ferrifornacis]|uniref:Uncharacterized protein n=1 Tax=Acidiluteibacter ferrifornacis TaxID=2692424 RepID=A0A6N9NPB1_9FLAO|nr:hypothetical protein [Acidiluteibacter ferrifornacis]NBG67120.1 hypothetical protein [Acidiluteibacter ferrifornacis]
MLKFLLIILIAFFTFNSFSQTNSVCEPLVVNDSLFQLKSDPYNFGKSSGNYVQSVRRDLVTDINDIITIEKDCIIFKINYACGCGDNNKQLVSNGILLQDNQGLQYYEIKFLFINYNKGCKALCHDLLYYDISELKNSTESVYLKFDEFEDLIEY